MKRSPKPGLALSVIALALLAASCADADADDKQAGDASKLGALAGMTFLSTAVTADDQPYDLVPDTRISLQFTTSAVSANAGCNHLGADASYADDVLVVADGGLSMTEMGCDKPRMAQDTWLADILASKPQLTLDGDHLTVTSGGTVIELIDQQTAEPDQALVGTIWALDSLGQSGEIGDDGITSSIPSDVSSTLTVDGSGRLSLQPGCNSGGGQVEIADSTLTFGPIALTRMACAGDPMEVESAVLAVLDGEVSYTIDGGTLTVTKGLQSLTYRAQLS